MEKVLSDLKKTVYRHTIFWLMGTNLWFNLLKYTVPFIRLTPYYPKLRRFVFQKLYNILEPGDLIFQVDEKKLTAVAIGGEWSHVGVCVDKGPGRVEVVDMTHEDFRQTDFFEFCKESTRIAIGRVDDPRWNAGEFILNVWEEEDSVYNFQFRAKERTDPRGTQPVVHKGRKVHKFNYCSQLVTTADRKNIIEVNWEDLAGLGIPYVSPTGLAKASNVKIIGDSQTI